MTGKGQVITEIWLTGLDDVLAMGREGKTSVSNTIMAPLLLLIDYGHAGNRGLPDLLHGQMVVNKVFPSLFLLSPMGKTDCF